jgi:hypothetical protein
LNEFNARQGLAQTVLATKDCSRSFLAMLALAFLADEGTTLPLIAEAS